MAPAHSGSYSVSYIEHNVLIKTLHIGGKASNIKFLIEKLVGCKCARIPDQFGLMRGKEPIQREIETSVGAKQTHFNFSFLRH